MSARPPASLPIPFLLLGGRVSVRAGRRVRQHRREFGAELLLPQKVRPHDHPAVGGQLLVGERNPNRRSACGPIKIQPHRLVRLMSRLCCSWSYHHHKHARRCAPFPTASLRLRVCIGSPIFNAEAQRRSGRHAEKKWQSLCETLCSLCASASKLGLSGLKQTSGTYSQK